MIKNSKRFAEIERLMSDYFGCHIAPVMQQTKDYLSKKQVEEIGKYQTSLAGILSVDNMGFDHSMERLQMTGKWNSKTTEDYLAMCKDKILKDTKLQKDLAVVAGEWRNAVVKEIGRARYDQLSKAIGGDLAYAFLDHRMEQLMINKMVKDHMPKSSADYVIKRAAESSLFGLPQVLRKTELDHEIDSRCEADYKPSKKEKIAGTVVGSVADAVALGGAGGWASLARFVGIDLAVTGGMSMLEKPGKKATTVEQCISQGVFGSKNDVFGGFRKQGSLLKTYEDSYIKEVNNKLNKKTPTMEPLIKDWSTLGKPQWTPTISLPTTKRDPKYKDVPMIVMPGKEEEYLKAKAAADAQKAKEAKEAEEKAKTANVEKIREKHEASNGELETTAYQNNASQTEAATHDTQQGQQSPQTNENGWGNFFGNVADGLGLNGFGDIAKNFGFVLSMLPDALVGLFTGKTKSLNMNNSLLPVASIFAGMFVRNPILKMMLIGIGGMNLLNKTGHEALASQVKSEELRAKNGASSPQYRRYADEPLNPRISSPILQGNNLIATIDRVPCSIQLPSAVVDAHQSGALPLNKLANAVLAKYDLQRGYDAQQLASRNYANEQNERETIVRSRGIQ